MLRNLYDHVKDELPKRKRKEEEYFGDPRLPSLVKNALDQFVSHYKKEYERSGDLFKSPPVSFWFVTIQMFPQSYINTWQGTTLEDSEGNRTL